MTLTFEGTNDFEAVNKAAAWCHEKGFSVGSMCRDEPIGLMYGDYLVAKWKNMTPKERRTVDGKITSHNFRSGSVTVTVFRDSLLEEASK